MITLITLGIIFLISILGMLYWMNKTKNGELNLSAKSWHFKLMRWMWDIDTNNVANACPYYWSLVFSISLLPIYLCLRYIYVFISYIGNKIENYNNKKKTNKKPKTVKKDKIKKIQSSVYINLYKKSKDYLLYIYVGILSLVLLIVVIYPLFRLFTFNMTLFIIAVSVLTITILTVITHIKNPNLDEYFLNPISELIINLWKIIKLPFLLLSYPFKRLYKYYTRVCPAINWE